MKRTFTVFYGSDEVYEDLKNMGLIQAAKDAGMAKYVGRKLYFRDDIFTDERPLLKIKIHALKELLFWSKGEGLQKVMDYHIGGDDVSPEKRKNIEEYLMKRTPNF